MLRHIAIALTACGMATLSSHKDNSLFMSQQAEDRAFEKYRAAFWEMHRLKELAPLVAPEFPQLGVLGFYSLNEIFHRRNRVLNEGHDALKSGALVVEANPHLADKGFHEKGDFLSKPRETDRRAAPALPRGPIVPPSFRNSAVVAMWILTSFFAMRKASGRRTAPNSRGQWSLIGSAYPLPSRFFP